MMIISLLYGKSGANAASIGYDIMVGVAVVKMWRIYYIFRKSTGKKRVSKSS